MTSPVAKALAGHTIAYGATTILSRASAVVLLVVLPLLISPADYGVLGLIMAANAVCITVVPLEVTQTVARFYPNAARADQIGYANAAWWFTVVSICAAAAIVAVFANPLAERAFAQARYAREIRVACAMVVVNGLFYFIQNQLRWSFRVGTFAIVSILFSASTLILGLGFAMLTSDRLTGVLAGQAVGAGLGCAVGLWSLRDTLSTRFDGAKLKEMLKVSVPLVPASLALMVNLYASRVALGDLATLRDVGVFTYANQIAGLSSLVIIGFQGSLIPLVMSHHEHPETPGVLARSFEHFVVLATAVCLLIGLLAPEAVHRFGEPAYASAALCVLPLTFAAILGQIYIFGPGFLIAKRTTWQAALALSVAVLCICANYLLIPAFGIAGAIAASILSTGLYATLWFALSQRLYPIPVRWWRVVALGAGAAGGGALLNAVPLGVWSIPAKLCWTALAVTAGAALRLIAPRQIMAATAGVGARIAAWRRRPTLSAS